MRTDINEAYGHFRDQREGCEAQHRISGRVPRDGSPATVTLTCQGCGQSHVWAGPPEQAWRLLDVCATRCRREPWPTTH